MEGLQEVTKALPTGTIPDPLQPGGSQPQPKTAIAIISGMGKATDFKFGRYIHPVIRTKPVIKKTQEKRERGRIQ